MFDLRLTDLLAAACQRRLVSQQARILPGSIGWTSFLLPVFLIASFAIFQFAASTAEARSRKPACQGASILEELAEERPAAFANVMQLAARTPNTQAMLWKLTREGTPPSYLFGTAHMTDPRITKLSKAVKDAIASSKVVALEISDVSPMAMAQAISQAPQLMLFEGQRRLDLLLSPEEFSAVRRQLEIARLPSQFAKRFKPWVVSMVMAISECERRRMNKGHLVLDMIVAERAREADIPVVGLETIEDQLTAAAKVPMEEQIALLRAGLSLADRAEDLRETILQLYLSRNLGAALPLQQFIAQRYGDRNLDFRGFRSRLIDKRNRMMRTHALPLLQQGHVFIAVGALHLIGDNGLVALLRNAGYEVTPVE